MTHPIVFRVAAMPSAPDFDAFEINEEPGEERFIGYVMVPLAAFAAGDERTIRIHILKQDGGWTDEALPYETPWSEATQLLYMKLLLNIENCQKRWMDHGNSPARVSLKPFLIP